MSGWVPREANPNSVDLVSAIEAAAESNSWDAVKVGRARFIIYSSFDVWLCSRCYVTYSHFSLALPRPSSPMCTSKTLIRQMSMSPPSQDFWKVIFQLGEEDTTPLTLLLWHKSPRNILEQFLCLADTVLPLRMKDRHVLLATRDSFDCVPLHFVARYFSFTPGDVEILRVLIRWHPQALVMKVRSERWH